MIPVPDKERDILDLAHKLIEQCRVSVGARSTYCRLINTIAETGRFDGSKALVNLLHNHLDRTAAHLFSPVELKFTVDFENRYPKHIIERGAVAGEILTRSWERSNTDEMFARGVFESLKYGISILKQWPVVEKNNEVVYMKKLVMPWQFGVYREDINDIDLQECVCETSTLTLPEVWQRIFHLPNSKKLFDKIKANAKTGEPGGEPSSYFHQVLSTSQLNTSPLAATTPGGIVGVTSDANYSLMGPVIAADCVQMHELWVKDEDDYTTIQLIEPDILVAPLYKKANLLIAGSRMQPYRVIQPNEVTNWFWGRSELVDLIEPQGLLAQWCDDAKRLMGLQIDKILAFVGENGIKDEIYDDFRSAGYIALQPGSDIKDVTPKVPPELLPIIKWLIEVINVLGGFPPIMQGQGEPGVRAGSHAGTLMKTASPTLRDRALLVERQCAMCADLSLTIKEAKDPNHYWTKFDTIEEVESTKFLLSELPDDWRVLVDSHSSSPIFSDENQQMIFALRKTGDVGGEYVIDNLPLPNKEIAKAQLREREKNKAIQMQKLLQEHPDLGEALAKKQLIGSTRR